MPARDSGAGTIVHGLAPPVPSPTKAPAAAPARAPAKPSPSRPSTRTPAPAGAKMCPTCGERFPLDYRVCPRDVVPLEHLVEADADPMLGALLSDVYRVTRLIGQGGMGRVYEARHARLAQRRFAIKVMHDELARRPELVTRFRREAETACVAAHPNVVQVFDVHETELGTPFIVAELLEGEDLGQRLDRVGRLGLSAAIAIVRQLCAALSTAHAQGVVHRDLKPDNVFLVGTDAPMVKLLDFGIARVNDTAPGNRTRTGVIMGTPAYMAPEQARGARVDARADIYSVGAILYRCLTGHEPFEAEDPAATLTMVLTRDPIRPRTLAPEIDDEVELVIERAMARDVGERFGTLAEFDAALARLQPQQGGAEGPSSSHGMLAPLGTTTGSGSHVAGSDAAAPSAREVQRARPMVVLLSFATVVLVVGALATAAARTIVASRGEALGGSEGTLLVLALIGVLATPVALWIRWLRRTVWGNSMRAVALARRMTAMLAGATIAWSAVAALASSFDLLLAEAPTATVGAGAAIASLVAAAITTAWIGRSTARVVVREG
ncbi:MAG: serine/threonine protein kinase [Deltaproteobacteria bacterium]|nr:serine/threonine protein kinase [Deltaproteobacteria bacterium]